MRPKIVAANWKMYKEFDEGLKLATEVARQLPRPGQHETQVILLTPFIHLEAISKLPEAGRLQLGAQNCHEQAKGAFTGEVSASMLRSVGAQFVLVGHSERRQYLGEDSTLLAQKMNTALNHGLHPIFCCGESQQSRSAGQQETFVNEQLSKSLFHLTEAQIARIIIAYEPVWAIGTGETASPEQAQEMHAFIRSTITEALSTEIAEQVSILYGGSVKPNNAADIFSKPDVDGGLIGGASLKAEDFVAIIKAI